MIAVGKGQDVDFSEFESDSILLGRKIVVGIVKRKRDHTLQILCS